jgi:hypothetical protein
MSRLKSLSLLAAFLSIGSAFAQGHAALEVVAHIQPRTSVALREKPALLQVSAEDVRRGYVQVTEPLRIVVRTNVAPGVTLDVSSPLEWVARVEVRAVDGTATSGSRVMLPVGTHDARLLLRIYLAPQAVPGAHPFAVQVAQDA